jgi:hypothetical protein
MLESLNKVSYFYKALVLAIGVHVLDILTTLLVEVSQAGHEGNAFLADPNTGLFLVKKAILVKILWLLLGPGAVAMAVKFYSKNWFLASLPLLFEAWRLFTGADASNIGLYIAHLVS